MPKEVFILLGTFIGALVAYAAARLTGRIQL